MNISPLAGKPAPEALLVDVPSLVTAYFSLRPDPSVAAQRVAFGTSGHRGSSFDTSFNEDHVLAITQAICDYRAAQADGGGPLFLGVDTHALSAPARASALEVLAANGVDVMLSADEAYTPTPAVSLAVIAHNRGRKSALADGIVITPSHNPPESGGFKYNPPHGGPAGADVTDAIEAAANAYLRAGLAGVKRMPLARALKAAGTRRYDYLGAYVSELDQVIDMAIIRDARVHLGVDPLGGAGVHYWARIAEHYKLNLSVISETIDPTFRFMSVDWDGRIRMDPSSPYAMQGLVALRERYDLAVACDTDHDRHGIVCPRAGLMPPNHYLAVAINYLFRHRPAWSPTAGVGKTLVSTSMIDLICAKLGRPLHEVPVGFKWFVAGLCDGTLGFCGEESAGAVFLREDGGVWTTDKDGLVPALLAAEILARTGRDPGEHYRHLTEEFGEPLADRVEAPADAAQKDALAALTPQQLTWTELAGKKIQSIVTKAPDNGADIGGLKVSADGCWFAARASGTEAIYKIYAETFHGPEHLRRILGEAQAMVDAALAPRA